MQLFLGLKPKGHSVHYMHDMKKKSFENCHEVIFSLAQPLFVFVLEKGLIEPHVFLGEGKKILLLVNFSNHNLRRRKAQDSTSCLAK